MVSNARDVVMASVQQAVRLANFAALVYQPSETEWKQESRCVRIVARIWSPPERHGAEKSRSVRCLTSHVRRGVVLPLLFKDPVRMWVSFVFCSCHEVSRV